MSVSAYPQRLAKQRVETLPETQESEAQAAQLKNEWNRISAEKALEIYLRLAKQAEIRSSPKQTALFLRKASEIFIILGNPQNGIGYLEKSLKLEKLAQNPDGTAETMILLSFFHSTLGQTPKSDFFLKSALVQFDKVQTDLSKARVSFFAGEVFFSREDIPNFLKFYEQARAFYEKANDNEGRAKTLFALSYANVAADRLNEALQFAADSYDLWKEIGSKRGETLALSQIGLCQFRLGQTNESLKSLKMAEKMFSADVDKTEKAILFFNLGRVYESFEDCNLSKSFYQQTEKLLVEENNLSYLVGILWSLGALTARCGENQNAEDYLKNSLELAQKLYKKADIIHAQIELGTLYQNIGRFDEAEKNFLSAQDLLKKTPFKMNSAKVFAGLGKLSEKTGQIQKARQNYYSAIKFFEEIKDDFAVADLKFALSRLANAENNFAAALNYIEDSIELTEHLSNRISNSSLQKTFFSNVHARYEFFIGLLMKLHALEPQKGFDLKALQASEKSRARSILEALSLSNAQLTKNTNIQTVERELETRKTLNSKSEKLTDLISQKADPAEIQKLDREVNLLKNQLEEIKSELKQNSPLYWAIKNPPDFDLSNLQNKLPDENTIFIEVSLGTESSYLWVVGKKEFRSFVLPPRSLIEDRIDDLRTLLAAREPLENESIEQYQNRIQEADIVYWQKAQSFSDELFGPIASIIKGKRLLFAPDGKFHYFPITALPIPFSSNFEPFISGHEIIYQLSAQTYLQISNSPLVENKAVKSLLVFADPVFTDKDSRLTGQIVATEDIENDFPTSDKLRFVESFSKLSRLPASEEESQMIGRIGGQDETDIFKGFEATRNNLLNLDLSKYRILHFSTHAFADEVRPELSGILLSGVDPNGQKLSQVVRLQDIYGFNLNADLVVLSACNTGIGKEIKGDGLQSLNNAFLSVGAKSVVASLWKVEDSATLELMKHFYEGLATGHNSTSEALRKAQLQMLKNPRFQSPFYWAAFTVQGEFSQKPKLSAPFELKTTHLIGGGFLALSILVIFHRKKFGNFFKRRK